MTLQLEANCITKSNSPRALARKFFQRGPFRAQGSFGHGNRNSRRARCCLKREMGQAAAKTFLQRTPWPGFIAALAKHYLANHSSSPFQQWKAPFFGAIPGLLGRLQGIPERKGESATSSTLVPENCHGDLIISETSQPLTQSPCPAHLPQVPEHFPRCEWTKAMPRTSDGPNPAISHQSTWCVSWILSRVASKSLAPV